MGYGKGAMGRVFEGRVLVREGRAGVGSRVI